MSVYRSWNDGPCACDWTGRRESAGVSSSPTSARERWSLIWLEDAVFLTISDGVLVHDRAPYHLTLTDDARPDTTKMKKAKCAEWLTRHDELQPSWLSQEWRQLKTKADVKAEAGKHRPAPWYQV